MLLYLLRSFSNQYLPFILMLGLAYTTNAQVLINQVDDFNDGTTQGWTRGIVDTFVTNQSNQLRVRTLDRFSSEGGVANSRLVVYNDTQWKGDYLSQGITGIKFKISNPLSSKIPLRIRVAIGNTTKPGGGGSQTGTWFVSDDAVVISPDSGTVEKIISIKEEDLNRARNTGNDSYESVLSNVQALRITASTPNNEPRGDNNVIAIILIDDITACGDCTPTETDLSNDRLNPSIIQFSATMDTVSNCFQNGDPDYFRFEVPADSILTGIKLTSYENGGTTDRAFLGIQRGTIFTEPIDIATAANLLGGIVFGGTNVGTDILPEMGDLMDSEGFTPPLPAGNYTIWLNQHQGPSCGTFQFLFGDQDLSDDRLNPSVILLSESMDTVSNCQKGNPRDIDYFTFNVPENKVLNELVLKNYAPSDVSTNRAFIGIQEGTTFTIDPFSPSANDLLGGLTYGTNHIGMDLLPLMGNLGNGFTAPLSAGNYTIWLNQTGPQSCATLGFGLTTINDCPTTLTFTDETVSTDTFKAEDTIQTIGNVLIANNSIVNFQAGKVIQLNSGFHAVAGSSFLAQIMDCAPTASLVTIENEINQQLFAKPSSNQLLLKVYPNPFYNHTTIEYQLNREEKVNIFLYDLSGKLVKTMVNNELQSAGIYQYDFSKEDLQEGMYLVYLKTAKEQLIQKLMLMN